MVVAQANAERNHGKKRGKKRGKISHKFSKKTASTRPCSFVAGPLLVSTIFSRKLMQNLSAFLSTFLSTISFRICLRYHHLRSFCKLLSRKQVTNMAWVLAKGDDRDIFEVVQALKVCVKYDPGLWERKYDRPCPTIDPEFKRNLARKRKYEELECILLNYYTDQHFKYEDHLREYRDQLSKLEDRNKRLYDHIWVVENDLSNHQQSIQRATEENLRLMTFAQDLITRIPEDQQTAAEGVLHEILFGNQEIIDLTTDEHVSDTDTE